MKKHRFLRSICLVMAMLLLFSSGTIAQGRANSTDGQISDATMADILNKLNYGLDSRQRITELPMEATVVIPDDFVPDNTPYEHFYPENMTDDEIEAVIERIANGENVMFGDGAPADFEELLPPSRWKAGTNGHQWITARAFTILQNDKPSVYNWFATRGKATTITAADWPDNNEGLLYNVASWHFYHGDYKTNYFRNGFNSDTAKSRLIYWYNKAVTEGKKGNWTGATGAAEYLGRAIHYLSDIGAPPHTGDRCLPDYSVDIALGILHGKYESDAQDRRNLYAMSSSPYYSWYTTYSLSTIAETNTGISYSHYGKCYNISASVRDPAIEIPMKLVQQDVAGFLYKFYYNVTVGGTI
ncbi:MAG: hypothetical protein FWC27_13970 [Firmicutes bacterium]|nr:hypothetical protein [Bacillota bacterium]